MQTITAHIAAIIAHIDAITAHLHSFEPTAIALEKKAKTFFKTTIL